MVFNARRPARRYGATAVFSFLQRSGQTVRGGRASARARRNPQGFLRAGDGSSDDAHHHGNTPLPNTLTPVYPASQGVGQAWLRRAIDQALADTPLPEILPETLQAEIIVPLRLPSLADAVAFLHRPDANADTGALAERTHPAWLRIKFEELLAQQLSLKRAHLARRQIRAPRMPRATHADTLSSRIER